jgi:hypothetical protein
LTCVFELQASTQAVDSGEIRPGSSCSAQGPTEGGGNEGGNEGGGGSEIESGGTEDDIDEDGASLDAFQTGSAVKGKKRKRNQNPGSNAEAHKIVKRCAVLWMRDPIGPTMGEATANKRRMELAREGARRFKVAGMDQLLSYTDADLVKFFEKRLKDCATTADKVRKALIRACYARTMTQVGLAAE